MDRFSAQSADRDRRILVVDDDDEARAGFVATLQLAGFQVAEAWGAVQAMRLLLSYRPDVVVLDLVLPDGHGFEVGRAMRMIVTTARTCVVAVTSNAASVGLVEPA
jgi:DNA-binding response OmpR family regulator